MTNVMEIFNEIAVKGQHPRMVSDTYILLEQLGHRLDRESERCFVEAKKLGLENMDITRYIEDNINLCNVLKKAAPVWDGGYVLCGGSPVRARCSPCATPGAYVLRFITKMTN